MAKGEVDLSFVFVHCMSLSALLPSLAGRHRLDRGDAIRYAPRRKKAHAARFVAQGTAGFALFVAAYRSPWQAVAQRSRPGARWEARRGYMSGTMMISCQPPNGRLTSCCALPCVGEAVELCRPGVFNSLRQR